MITKIELEDLVKKYETKDFIKDDPVQFPHNYSDRKDIEISGFISSMFSYGNRKLFIAKLKKFFEYTNNEPANFIRNGDFSIIKKNDFNYRFSKPDDIIEMLKILSALYNNSDGLMELFAYGYKQNNNIQSMFKIVVDYFYSRVNKNAGQGFYHLLPNPRKGGAMKRVNMFLRWMIRKSDVDLGIWNFMSKSELLIPLDVHVARLSREMGLLERKSNDMKAVVELTNNLKIYDNTDPVKYDFAIFGKGIEETYKN